MAFDRLNREKPPMENTRSEISQLLEVMHIQTTKRNVHGWFPEDPNVTKFQGRPNILAAYRFYVGNNAFPGAIRVGLTSRNRRDVPLSDPELQRLLNAVKNGDTAYMNELNQYIQSPPGTEMTAC